MAADGSTQLYPQDHVEQILDAVLRAEGIDFRHYRHGTLHRRIGNRMLAIGLTDIGHYVERIRREPGEARCLLERLTIKVSRFMRNRPVFDRLHSELIRLAARHPWPLRIWSAGCATGEEAYSLALILERNGISGTVVATDIDPAALQRASAGRYRRDVLHEMSPEEIDDCFDCPANREDDFRVTDQLRRRVRFERHDLMSGPMHGNPQFDLICCRNVLIYLQPAAQQAALNLLTNALVPEASLCLGEAEWPCAPVDQRLDVACRALKIFHRRV